MTTNTVSSFLPPLIALFLAAVSIAALYYWWMTSEESKDEEPGGGYEKSATSLPNEDSAATGGFLTDSISYMQSLVARIRGVSDDTGVGGSRMQSSPPPHSTTSPQPYQHTTPMPPAYSPTTFSATTPSPAMDGETVEVLRILRDLADGTLIVDIGGRRYRRIEAIEDQRVSRRVQGVAYDLARFVDPDSGMERMAGTQTSVSPPPPPPASSTSPLDPMKAPPAPPIITPPPPTSAASPPIKKKEGDQEEEKVDLRSMADQIEELLQARLAMTPELATREIHIHEAFGGGVTIQVDDQYFDGVGDVTDYQVREFIQTIIREWEARQ